MLNFMTPGSGSIKPLSPETHRAWTRRVSQAGCLVEPWRCDLSSGAFMIGSKTAALLGLRRNPCGIVDLVRAYDRGDRSTILNILEQATESSSSFCFSTTVRGITGHPSPLYCIGNSTLTDEGAEGSLEGVFALPDSDNPDA
ncbi:hypothetical protein ACLMJV_08075 [Sinorhizobium meliloti]|uniref:PAS domain-containing protein n=1 Tax=Rhizobium meliloti TaxID=382 RepID=A0A2J0Z8H1_RHIML|nr:hypothetical protein [Sinorhizobium meliloti]PJR16758.1 hypothetical protein CEJ86_00665 [Sinorhizobium meliloti]GCA48718.1 hypothetical protein KGO5_01152 [Sinorhizobium sp. KGO-5]